jgi:hypothetical protein
MFGIRRKRSRILESPQLSEIERSHGGGRLAVAAASYRAYVEFQTSASLTEVLGKAVRQVPCKDDQIYGGLLLAKRREVLVSLVSDDPPAQRILAPHTRPLRAVLTAPVQIRDVKDADRPPHPVSLHDWQLFLAPEPQ